MDKLIHYKIFQRYKNVVAFTTTKQSLDKAAVRFTGDEKSVFLDNRKQLAALLNIDIRQLVFPRQTHSNLVCKLIDIPEKEIAETDALVSDKTGLCLCVQTADCVPILLYDPIKSVAAAVHAGWRGTVSQIVAETVRKMKTEYSSSTENILAAIGPSIGPDIYEVGDEVVKAARNSIPGVEKALHKNASGKYHFDLWEANRLILMDCGLLSENIEVLAECSFLEDGKYFSARREGEQTGRMVSGIMLL
ncbi:MAG TPA: peptidoglycan editing factor PgeF [Draconibacterium sp.]|nr:peptidoglycan editing factor PgeF [Draconibacterium sp.]